MVKIMLPLALRECSRFGLKTSCQIQKHSIQRGKSSVLVDAAQSAEFVSELVLGKRAQIFPSDPRNYGQTPLHADLMIHR